MCWTALRTSDSSEGDAAASPDRPQIKTRRAILAGLILIFFYPVATAPGSDSVPLAPVTAFDFRLNFRAIAEKPGARPQSSSNEGYGQIVSPKKNRCDDQQCSTSDHPRSFPIHFKSREAIACRVAG